MYIYIYTHTRTVINLTGWTTCSVKPQYNKAQWKYRLKKDNVLVKVMHRFWNVVHVKQPKCYSSCSIVASDLSSGSLSATLTLLSLLFPLNGFPSLTDSVCRTELSSLEELRVKVEVDLLSELVASKSLPMKLSPAWRMWELPANTYRIGLTALLK